MINNKSHINEPFNNNKDKLDSNTLKSIQYLSDIRENLGITFDLNSKSLPEPETITDTQTENVYRNLNPSLTTLVHGTNHYINVIDNIISRYDIDTGNLISQITIPQEHKLTTANVNLNNEIYINEDATKIIQILIHRSGSGDRPTTLQWKTTDNNWNIINQGSQTLANGYDVIPGQTLRKETKNRRLLYSEFNNELYVTLTYIYEDYARYSGENAYYDWISYINRYNVTSGTFTNQSLLVAESRYNISAIDNFSFSDDNIYFGIVLRTRDNWGNYRDHNKVYKYDLNNQTITNINSLETYSLSNAPLGSNITQSKYIIEQFTRNQKSSTQNAIMKYYIISKENGDIIYSKNFTDSTIENGEALQIIKQEYDNYFKTRIQLNSSDYEDLICSNDGTQTYDTNIIIQEDKKYSGNFFNEYRYVGSTLYDNKHNLQREYLFKDITLEHQNQPLFFYIERSSEYKLYKDIDFKLYYRQNRFVNFQELETNKWIELDINNIYEIKVILTTNEYSIPLFPDLEIKYLAMIDDS